MNPIPLCIVLALLMGVASVVQSTSNALLAGHRGLAFAVFLNACLVMAGALLFWRFGPESPSNPTWPRNPLLYLGGAYGIFLVVSAAYAFPRLGAGPTTALIVTAQLLASLVLDHWGIPGGRVPVDLTRLLGALLLGAGALLVLWPKLR